MPYTEANGVRISYRQSGEPTAHPVLLLHGGASTSATWDRLTPLLTAAGRRVVACDLRGHGDSGRSDAYPLTGFRDDVLALVDTLELETFSLVGHSLGAYVATLVAQAAPARVTRLVLEDPPARPRDSAAAAPVSRLRMLLLAVGSLSRRRAYDPRAVTSAIAQLREPDPAWWTELEDIVAPTLVLSGGPTSHLSPERMAELAAALPHGELRTIPAGHRIHSERPDEFAAAVVPFLAGPGLTDRRA